MPDTAGESAVHCNSRSEQKGEYAEEKSIRTWITMKASPCQRHASPFPSIARLIGGSLPQGQGLRVQAVIVRSGPFEKVIQHAEENGDGIRNEEEDLLVRCLVDRGLGSGGREDEGRTYPAVADEGEEDEDDGKHGRLFATVATGKRDQRIGQSEQHDEEAQ